MKWLLDCLIIQLTKRNEPYAHNDKRLKYLTDLTRNTNTDRDNIKLSSKGPSIFQGKVHHIGLISTIRTSTVR